MADVIKQIRDIYPQLSSAKKSAASYFLNHFHSLQFATVTELAELIGVSDTTIINLCADLGYSGYSGFKKAVRANIQAEASSIQASPDASGQSSLAMIQAVASPIIQSISETFTDAKNCDAIVRAAQMLTKAKTIYAIGFWSSASLAQELCLQLRRKGWRAEAIFPSLGDYIDKVLQITKDDIVVMYDFSRYIAGLNEICLLLQKQGVPIILVTDMGPCPCLPYASVSIHCHPAETHKSTLPQAAIIGYLLRILAFEMLPQEQSDYETLREGVFTRFNSYGVIEPDADYNNRV